MTGFYMKGNTRLKWVKDSPSEKLLSIKTNIKLNFEDQIIGHCKKEIHKSKALARTTSCMFLPKKFQMNSFFNTYFNYCPLI